MKKLSFAWTKPLSMTLLFIAISLFFSFNGFAFMKGDINNDGKIDHTEAIYALEVVAGLRTTTYVNIINVPADFDTIQEAVDAASSGDKIVVAAGTYNETVTIDLARNTISFAVGDIDFPPLSPSVMRIVEAGGLVPYVKERLRA